MLSIDCPKKENQVSQKWWKEKKEEESERRVETNVNKEAMKRMEGRQDS